MPETVMVISSRFQPLHLAHVEFWREARKRYQEHLVICVLRRSQERAVSPKSPKDEHDYLSGSLWTRAAENNPIPNFQRLRLVEIAVSVEPTLRGNTTVMLRDRPDTMWERSIQDLPPNRVWAFDPSKSDFDKSKPDFYMSKGEETRTIEFSTADLHSGRDIRNRLRNGSVDLSFLPEACRDYFARECLPFMIEKPTRG